MLGKVENVFVFIFVNLLLIFMKLIFICAQLLFKVAKLNCFPNLFGIFLIMIIDKMIMFNLNVYDYCEKIIDDYQL